MEWNGWTTGEGGVHCFCLKTGHWTARHSPRFNRWKGPSLPQKKKKKKRLEHGADCTVTNGEKKKSAKEQRSERERVWIDPTQAYIVNNSA